MSEIRASSNAGALDPAFADKGVLSLPLPRIPGDEARCVLALPQSKTLLVIPWLASGPIVVARLNEDGTLDTSYGDRQLGFVELLFEGTEIDRVGFKIGALADGGCVVTGLYGSRGIRGLIAIRLRQDGSLEQSFGNGGVRLIPEEDFRRGTTNVAVRVAQKIENDGNDPSTAQGNSGGAVAEDPDGKIVLVSNTFDSTGRQKAVALRLNPDGSTDQSFNGGFAIVELQGVAHLWSSARDVAVQSDGKVVVCGQYGDNDRRAVFVMRFNSQGKVDAEFNSNRPVTITASEYIDFRSIRVSKTAILVVGEANRSGVNHGLIVMLNSSGSYNLVFNNGAPLFSNLMPGFLYWRQCALQSEGTVIVTGVGRGTDTRELSVVTARYRADGKLDSTFNDGKGFAVFENEMGTHVTDGMDVMEDGRIVICASWLDLNIKSGGWVLRYLG
ncbi:hypothetical protein [Pseudomonas sp. RA_35y_Pfl2_P32]|uniref:hypothetical protein n=1 Tax=Pseudomonas sp. RA_35y_Pfl2_P32 TaxID=3088705 RepID=UPI0030DA7EB3